MKAALFTMLLTTGLCLAAPAQKTCYSNDYSRQAMQQDPSLALRVQDVENFVQRQISTGVHNRVEGITVIRIPVVVHVLYHLPGEKISEAAINKQIDVLNRCFRRRSADTVNTPARFRSLAADCEIEFQLAISDPRRRSTSGIVYKYTPISRWKNDDRMKFSSEMGDDAWDPKSYLNIWVCNMELVAGYASFPGGDAAKDGVVISFSAFGVTDNNSGLDQGKTAVHEVAHWLGLRHIWGDQYCGDDGVDDTPKQAGYNVGCPTVIRSTCGNGPNGDMFMNYMDLTNDGCMNLFTRGQKARMQALFGAGGARNGILISKGLSLPLIMESPALNEDPRWLEARMYPNPATTELTLDLSYDPRWLGKNIYVTNVSGQTIANVLVSSKIQRIDISALRPGIYFIAAKKDDGESIKMKFVKL